MNHTVTTTSALTAEDAYETHKDILLGSAALVFYERYRIGRVHGEEPTWRAYGITKISMAGQLVIHSIAQLPRSVALDLTTLCLQERGGLITRWGDLTPLMQRRIVASHILPLEFKTIQRMDRIAVETQGDSFLMLAGPGVMGLLS